MNIKYKEDCIKIYNLLDEHGYLTKKQIERLTGIKERTIRLCFSQLRILFNRGEVDKHVCANPNGLGYFLSDKQVDAEFSLRERETKAITMLNETKATRKAFENRFNMRMEV
ncbi:MAG: hypothetical protein ACK5LC_02415 [Coprobacillaceae bacterium]